MSTIHPSVVALGLHEAPHAVLPSSW